MSVDERIKQELESEAEKIDEILNDKEGLFDLVVGSYKSGLGMIMAMVNVVILIVSGLMLWSAYEFFIAGDLDARIFWGICLVITLNMQIALKQWTWAEMGRSSLLREIKRVEVAVIKLDSRIEK